jgi:hypothetical protein
VHKLATSVSLYFNGRDYALVAAHAVDRDTRVGQGPFFLDGLDNIDAQKANTSFLGHVYYASEKIILLDMQLLLGGVRAAQRPTLRQRTNALPPTVYWFFP